MSEVKLVNPRLKWLVCYSKDSCIWVSGFNTIFSQLNSRQSDYWLALNKEQSCIFSFPLLQHHQRTVEQLRFFFSSPQGYLTGIRGCCPYRTLHQLCQSDLLDQSKSRLSFDVGSGKKLRPRCLWQYIEWLHQRCRKWYWYVSWNEFSSKWSPWCPLDLLFMIRM